MIHSVICGYHENKNIWEAAFGEFLQCQREREPTCINIPCNNLKTNLNGNKQNSLGTVGCNKKLTFCNRNYACSTNKNYVITLAKFS